MCRATSKISLSVDSYHYVHPGYIISDEGSASVLEVLQLPDEPVSQSCLMPAPCPHDSLLKPQTVGERLETLNSSLFDLTADPSADLFVCIGRVDDTVSGEPMQRRMPEELALEPQCQPPAKACFLLKMIQRAGAI
jgi:hypothetical protein